MFVMKLLSVVNITLHVLFLAYQCSNSIKFIFKTVFNYVMNVGKSTRSCICYFLAHDRMSVASLCNHDLSVVVVVVVVVVCEHSS